MCHTKEKFTNKRICGAERKSKIDSNKRNHSQKSGKHSQLHKNTNGRNGNHVDYNARNGKLTKEPCGKGHHHACLYCKLSADEHSQGFGNFFKADFPEIWIAVVQLAASQNKRPEESHKADTVCHVKEKIESNDTN